jgi:hypothetical protein
MKPKFETTPSLKRKMHPDGCINQCGDGGNRTRVRKNRSSKIYERSRLRLVATGHSVGKIDLQPSARVRRPFFHALSGVLRGTLPIVSPSTSPGWSSGRVDAISLMEIDRFAHRLCSEGHSGVRSAVGTWCFALSLRDRRRSARIPGPASPVEACHPRFGGQGPRQGLSSAAIIA